jgi:hypothetical protein
MASLAFAFPLKAGKTEEWRAWIAEVLGPRRGEYEAFSRQVGLKTQHAYLQHTPRGTRRSSTWRERISSARSSSCEQHRTPLRSGSGNGQRTSSRGST